MTEIFEEAIMWSICEQFLHRVAISARCIKAASLVRDTASGTPSWSIASYGSVAHNDVGGFSRTVLLNSRPGVTQAPRATKDTGMPDGIVSSTVAASRPLTSGPTLHRGHDFEPG